jgi:RND family efflux transporter MFP subunit
MIKRALLLIAGLAVVAAILFAFRARVPFLHRVPTLAQPVADPSPTPAAGAAANGTARGDVTIDPRRQQLIGVRTVQVTRGPIERTLRTVGAVRSDETRQAEINIKVEGWIRDLYVDYTGQRITRGQPLFTLYSPDILATENEYLVSVRTRDRLQQSPLHDARERADQLVAAARQRLALWDLPPEELRALDATHQTHESVTFRSPVAGYVTERQALKGLHVMPGQMLYKVTDLSVVWVEADVYETDLPLVRIGARATITTDAYPGERIAARVVYIYPSVSQETRTTKVRYELPNRGGRLKPGMFANVEFASSAGIGLKVPTNAVLDSGREQIVFVAEGDGRFEPRRVTVGRRLGDDVQIVSGVKEGELVAEGATFFLDSESQLRAALQGYEPIRSTAGPPAASAERVDVTFRIQPDPPKVGRNQLEVTVKDAAGIPIDDAQVSVQFYMPAMPTMNMPAMRNDVTLTPAGGGVYRGSGEIMMTGRWDATVTVTRGGQRLASTQVAVVAR